MGTTTRIELPSTENMFEDTFATSYSPVWWNKKLGALLVTRDCVKFQQDDSEKNREGVLEEDFDINIALVDIESIRTKPGHAYMKIIVPNEVSYRFQFADEMAMTNAKTIIKRMRETSLSPRIGSLAAIVEADDVSEATFDHSVSNQHPADKNGVQPTILPPSSFSVPNPRSSGDGGRSGGFGAPAITPPSSGNMGGSLARGGSRGNTGGALPSGNTTAGLVPNNVGRLLYEVKFKEERDGWAGEDATIQFFEHVVVIRRLYLNGFYPDSYEMRVIPRFKIVGIHVSKQSETIPLWSAVSIRFGVIGYVVWLIGNILAFALLCLGGLASLLFLPWVANQRQRYFLTLDVLDNGPKSNFVVDCLAYLILCMRGVSDKETRTTPILFKSDNDFDEDFLIRYVYGVVGRQDYAAPAHMRSHLNTATLVRYFSNNKDAANPPSSGSNGNQAEASESVNMAATLSV